MFRFLTKTQAGSLRKRSRYARHLLTTLAMSVCAALFTQHLDTTSLKAASTEDPNQAKNTKPNVLLICIDDLKPTLGCYSDPVAVTPNIDALAKRGVLFSSAYCNQAVCSPSRNALLTSLRPQTIGIYDLGTNFRVAVPHAITLTQYFKNHGYFAQGLGKIFHTGHGNSDDQASWSIPSWRPKGPAYVRDDSLQQLRPDSKGVIRGPATESAETSDQSYADGKVAVESIQRLEQAAAHREQPFFLAVGFIRPHLPFVAPKQYWDLYDPAQLPMPEVLKPPVDAPDYAPTQGGELRSYAGMSQHIDPATTRHLIHGYYAATSYTDAQVGKVLEALERLGLRDNTIVVLWGDHGWHLGDHGMWCKHTNYEQANRIPLIMAAPGCSAGETSQALIESVDVYPTLAGLAGLPIPMDVDGQNFANLLTSPESPGREYALHAYPRGNRIGRALRDHRYRLVEWKIPGEPMENADIELYDYETDPLETKNIAAEQPQIVFTMRAELSKLPEAKPQLKNPKAQKPKSSQRK